MSDKIKILIVEDEMIIAAKISLQLNQLGYEVCGLLPRGEDALTHIAENRPDIVLLDIQLNGKLDGIETGRLLTEKAGIPIIYITANSDEATFNRAKATKPSAFISKPFKQIDLQRAIELTISRMKSPEESSEPSSQEDKEMPTILKDRIFVKHKERMVKIMFANILLIEAVRNYSKVITSQNEYLLSVTLKKIEDKLPESIFVRIHRSYLVNILLIEEVGEHQVFIESREIPMSGGLKDNLLQRITKF